jgi:4-hydroxy-3-methylbut-2-enyl diphosphate reductase
LQRIGVANQTTMLARESLAIADVVGAAIGRGRGDDARATSFRSFDTICSATQERQDAVRELLDTGVDVMVVIGGFNSSNTISLAALCADEVPTYHIETSSAINPDARSIHFREAAIKHNEMEVVDWIPPGTGTCGHHRRSKHTEQQDWRRGDENSCDARPKGSGLTTGCWLLVTGNCPLAVSPPPRSEMRNQ